MDKLRFQSFGSGSSGNCYYVGNATYGLLIDAGLSVRSIRKNLRELGLGFENIWAIFVTHDHADHIKSVGVLGEKFHIPVYTTSLAHKGIQKSYSVTEKLYGSRKYIEKGETVQVGDFSITAFEVSHDATDNVGYTIEYKEKRITFATDLGFVGNEAYYHLAQSDFIVIEANYDEGMLENGHYPVHLKNRIISSTGHLSNRQSGLFLSEAYNIKWQYIFLCHLSNENNLPELAFSTVRQYLEQHNDITIGKEIQLVTLERTNAPPLYIF